MHTLLCRVGVGRVGGLTLGRHALLFLISASVWLHEQVLRFQSVCFLNFYFLRLPV